MSHPTASTQYNDFKGTAALDQHGGPEPTIFDLAVQKGLDPDRYGPMIGFSLYGISEPFYCAVFVADKSKLGDQTPAEYANNNDGEIPVVEVSFSATLQELGTTIKRLDVKVFTKSSAITSSNVVEEISLD